MAAMDLGWDKLRNGQLLQAASANFDVLLTLDRKLKHQQNLAILPIAIVAILTPTSRFDDLVHVLPAVETALRPLQPRTLVEVSR